MNLLFWGLTISLIGKVLLAIGVLIAHAKIAHEHKIDPQVIRSIRIEFIITFIGLILIICGYALEIYYFHAAELLACETVECTDRIKQVTS